METTKMYNKALNSFLMVLVGLTLFMLLNILTSASYLYGVVGFHTVNQREDVPQVPRELTKHRDTASRNTDLGQNPRIATPNASKPAIATNIAKATVNASNPANAARKVKANVIQPRPDVCVNCFTHNFTYLIQNTSICATSGEESIELLILILTVHSNVKHRQNIRSSWTSHANNNTGRVRYAFLLGKTKNKELMDAVYAESKVYGDILMEDFTDAYSNLTYKTMMAMKWTTMFCPQTKYLMKTDDDMWVNVPQLLNLLDKRGQELQHGVGGACFLSAGPIRDKRSKWYASRASYPNDRYPGFCSGTGYVTSASVAKKLYEISPHIPFFHLEDVYLALCVKRLRMKLIPLPGFHNSRTALKPCEMRSSKIVTSHMVPTDFLLKIMEAKC